MLDTLQLHFHDNIIPIIHQLHTSCMIQFSIYKCLIPTDTSVYYDEVLTLVAKFTIVPVAVFIELVISVYTITNDCDIRQKYVISRRSSLKHYLLLSVQTIALWSILMALQLLAMTVTPLCVLLLIRPQVTITSIIFGLLASTSWFHSHCCLCAVSVSTTKKEKFPEQCKVLWKYVCVLHCNYCNHWTHSHTADPVRGDAASASTN